MASRRAASRLLSTVRPSAAAQIQCPCKANGCPGAAVNYPLYTALALEPILNDPSNLAGERKNESGERRRERGQRRSREGGGRDTLRRLAPRSAENTRGHEDREARRRDDVVVDDGEDRIEDEENDARWTDGLSGNRLVFQRSRHRSRRGLLLVLLSFSLPSRNRLVNSVRRYIPSTADECVRIANACGSTKHVQTAAAG